MRSLPGSLALWALVAASSLVLGCAAQPTPPPPDPVVGARDEYVLGAGDSLSIVVWKNPELNVSASVRPDGRISVPLVDDIQAEGLTPLELKDLITSELSEFVSAPYVSVVVREVRSKQINVIGEVPRPGRVILFKETRIVDVIAGVGGFGQFADSSRIKVIRPTENGDVTYVFDYDAYIDGRAPGTNFVLMPDDTVVVTD